MTLREEVIRLIRTYPGRSIDDLTELTGRTRPVVLRTLNLLEVAGAISCGEGLSAAEAYFIV